MKSTARHEKIKAITVTTAIMAAVGIVMTIVLYFPLWNHSIFALALSGLLTGARIARHATLNGWRGALGTAILHGAAIGSVWFHITPLVILTALTFLGIALRQSTSKLQK